MPYCRSYTNDFLRAKGYFPRLPWGIFVRINNNNFWFTELHRRRDDLQEQLAKKREQMETINEKGFSGKGAYCVCLGRDFHTRLTAQMQKLKKRMKGAVSATQQLKKSMNCWVAVAGFFAVQRDFAAMNLEQLAV